MSSAEQISNASHKAMQLNPMPDWLRAEATQTAFKLIEDAGYLVRAVGGCIRDTLLDGQNHPDIDMATTMPAEDLLALCRQKGVTCIPTGLLHGTVTLHLVDAAGLVHAFEITTLRKDIETDGRHANVAFTNDWLEDAKRRDLTINALYVDALGHVYDPLEAVGQSGLSDLKQRKICFIGRADQRIQEDYLRILRFFRFHFKLTPEDDIDADGLAACLQFKDQLATLSRERIRDELFKVLALPNADDALVFFQQYGFLTNMLCVEQVADVSKLSALNNIKVDGVTVFRLGALLVRAQDVAKLRTAVCLTNAETARLKQLWDGVFRQSVLDALGSLERLFELCYYKGVGAVIDQLIYLWVTHDDMPQNAQKTLDIINSWQRPVFPLTGQDFLDHGFVEGPRLGEAFTKVEAQWVGSHFTLTRAQLLEQVSGLDPKG